MTTGFRGRKEPEWAATANCDPAELDDYCFLMHDILSGRLGPEFDEDWIPMARPVLMDDWISMTTAFR